MTEQEFNEKLLELAHELLNDEELEHIAPSELMVRVLSVLEHLVFHDGISLIKEYNNN